MSIIFEVLHILESLFFKVKLNRLMCFRYEGSVYDAIVGFGEEIKFYSIDIQSCNSFY